MHYEYDVHIRGKHGQDQDWIYCRILAIFLDQVWIWIFIFEKIGSGQHQDICLISITKFSWERFKMSQTMVLLFSLLWFLYSQKIKVILSVGVLHWSQLMIINLCYFIVNIFRWSGSSKLLLYCWYAAFVLLCWVAYVCVVEANIVYFMGGQLVFDSVWLQNFLITRDRPVGNIVTNTKCQIWDHMCSVPSP